MEHKLESFGTALDTAKTAGKEQWQQEHQLAHQAAVDTAVADTVKEAVAAAVAVVEQDGDVVSEQQRATILRLEQSVAEWTRRNSELQEQITTLAATLKEQAQDTANQQAQKEQEEQKELAKQEEQTQQAAQAVHAAATEAAWEALQEEHTALTAAHHATTVQYKETCAQLAALSAEHNTMKEVMAGKNFMLMYFLLFTSNFNRSIHRGLIFFFNLFFRCVVHHRRRSPATDGDPGPCNLCGTCWLYSLCNLEY